MMSYFRLTTGGQAASGHGKLQSRLKQYGSLSVNKGKREETPRQDSRSRVPEVALILSPGTGKVSSRI